MHSSEPRRRRTRSPASVQITDRDRLLLAFAAEHRFITAAQLTVVLEVTAPAADTRLRTLRAGDYLRRDRKLHVTPAAHRITPAGLRAIGSDLPAPREVDLGSYRHDEGLAWLMLAAQRGGFGPLRAVISERRMRSEDARPQEGCTRHGVRLGGVGPRGHERRHYPDMVVVTESGHRVAFELELSTKAKDRREGIIAGYAADRSIDAVIYLVDRPGVGRAIERSVARVGVSHLIRVQPVRLGGSGPTGTSARAAERSHGRGQRHGDDGARFPERAR